MALAPRMAGSGRRLATVDRQDLPGDEFGLVVGEEYDRLRDLLRPAGPLHWHAGNQPGLAGLAAGKAVQHAGLHRTRRDGVDTDAEGSTLQRRRLRQPLHRVLAGGVDRGARRTLVA